MPTATDTTTPTTEGQFFAAPPIAAPVMPWRPGVRHHRRPGRDRSTSAVTSTCYSAPDFALDVNTLYAITPDGVVVIDSQLLPAPRGGRAADIRARTDQPIRYVTQQPPPPGPRVRQRHLPRGRWRARRQQLHRPHDRRQRVLVPDVPPGSLGRPPTAWATWCRRARSSARGSCGSARPSRSSSSSPTARPLPASRST